jgi:pimeloyl-ACP methyl ester carboxylesterase
VAAAGDRQRGDLLAVTGEGLMAVDRYVRGQYRTPPCPRAACAGLVGAIRSYGTGQKLEWNRDGRDTSVMLHGLRGEASIWTTVAEPLGEAGFRVLALDQRGRGFSDKP